MADTISQVSPLRGQLESSLATAEAVDHDGVVAATLRLILCAVDDRDVIARRRGQCGGCPEAAMLELLTTMAKQRRASAKDYDDAGRIAEAERERAELDVIESFMPQKLAGEELEAAVDEVVEDLEAEKLKDLGRCMAALKERYPGRVDTGSASSAVRKALR